VRRPGVRALLHATVTTAHPTLGARGEHGWLWPVGTLSGWWWDTELWNAERYGAEITIDQAVYYKAAPVLRAWSEWIVPFVEDPSHGATPFRAAVAKHMGRALIGRMGAKYPRWQPWCPCPDGALELRGFHDYDTRTDGRMLDLAGTTYLSTHERYVDDACPALLGCVMAECRVRLWRIVQAAGPAHVAYMDTDSVIVDREGARRLRAATRRGELWGLRVKATHRDLEILGPRQLLLGERGRVAGIDARAQRVGKHAFAGERWDGLTTTLATGSPDVVVVRSTLWTVKGTDHRRAHLARGLTRPLEAHEAGLDRARTPAAV
jgi:hypothetical protein